MGMNDHVKLSIVRVTLEGNLDITTLTQVSNLAGIKSERRSDANRKVIDVLREHYRNLQATLYELRTRLDEADGMPPNGGASSLRRCA